MIFFARVKEIQTERGKKAPKMAGFPPWIPDSDPDAMYVTVETVDAEKKATELPIVSMKVWLDVELPGNLSAKPLRDGKILVKAKDQKTVEAAMSKELTFFGNLKMQISKRDDMNTSKGTIFDRMLLNDKLETLMKDVEGKGVSKIERIESIKPGDNVRSPNGLHILTFNSKKPPTNIMIGYMRYNVRPDYPRPLRCVKCLLYGHTQKKCEEPNDLCRHCAELKHIGACKGPKTCRNCPSGQGLPHGSLDKECPVFQREEAICRMKVDSQISWGEARQRFQATVKNAEETYAKKAIHLAEETAKMNAEKLQEVREERANAEQLLRQLEKESEELKKITGEILRTKQRNDKMMEMIATANMQAASQGAYRKVPTQNKSPKPSTPLRPENRTKHNNGLTLDDDPVVMDVEQTDRFKRSLTLPSSDSDTATNKKRMTKDDGTSEDEESSISEEEMIEENETQHQLEDDHIINEKNFSELSQGHRRRVKKMLKETTDLTKVPLFHKKGPKIFTIPIKNDQQQQQARRLYEHVFGKAK